MLNQNTVENTQYINNTSDRYQPIQTSKIITSLNELGFDVSKYQEANFRKSEKQHKVKHMVRMAHRDATTYNGTRPEIVLFNSADCSTSFQIHYGLIRFICFNTLVVADSAVPSLKVKHSNKDPMSKIYSHIEQIKSAQDAELDLRKRMESQILTQKEIVDFIMEAMSIRESDMSEILDPMAINILQRPEDAGNDLWTVFNRAQEGLIRGNYKKLGSVTVDGEPQPIYKKAKEIKDVERDISINEAIYQLATDKLKSNISTPTEFII